MPCRDSMADVVRIRMCPCAGATASIQLCIIDVDSADY